MNVLYFDKLKNDYGDSIYLKRYVKLIEYYDKNFNAGDMFEKHHILPRSLYPEYEKSEDNLIKLPFRVHYIAHYILWKMTNTYAMGEAFKLMNNTKVKNSRLYNQEKTNIINSRKNKCVYYNKITKKNELVDLDKINDNYIHPFKGRKVYLDISKGKNIMTHENYDDNPNYTKPIIYGGKHNKVYWNGDTRTTNKNESTGRNHGFENGLKKLNDNNMACYIDLISKKYKRLPKNTNDHRYIKFSGHNIDKIYIIRLFDMYFLFRNNLPIFLKDRSRYIHTHGIEYFMNTKIDRISKNCLPNEKQFLQQYMGKKIKVKDIDIDIIWLKDYIYDKSHKFMRYDDEYNEYILKYKE